MTGISAMPVLFAPLLLLLAVLTSTVSATPVTTDVTQADTALRRAADVGQSASRVTADSHIHYLDFVQETDGFQSLVAAMDQVGVERAAIFGIPMVKLWSDEDPVRPTDLRP